jgi:hypothetical protein
MARDRASIIIAPTDACHEVARRVPPVAADHGDADIEERRKIGFAGSIGPAIGAPGMHVRLELAEQGLHVCVVEDDHVIHSCQRSDQSRPSPLGKNGPAFAFQFSRTPIGMNRHDEQITFGARGAEISNVADMKQVEYATCEYDFAARATMLFEYFMQTAAREDFFASIHPVSSAAG